VYRAHAVNQAYASLRDCRACFFGPVVLHDFRLWGLILIFSSLFFAKRKFLRAVATSSVILFSFAYFVDIVVFLTFTHQRLIYANALRYMDFRVWRYFLRSPENGWFFLLYAAPFAIGTLALGLSRGLGPRKLGLGVIAFGLVVSGLGMLPIRFEDPLAAQARNFIEANRMRGDLVPYSSSFLQASSTLFSGPEGPFQAGLSQKKDVIILFVESLSSYQSRFFSAIRDYTPHLDEIARDHTAFVNFHANSYYSTAGRVSLFAGIPGLPGQSGIPVLDNVIAQESLFSIFKKNGFGTQVFYAGLPNIDSFGHYMRQLGADHFSDSTDPFYRDSARYIFGSITDRLLYENVLRSLREPRSKEPLFIVAVTASSHQPFQNPETGAKGQEAAFRYADAQIYDFYQALRKLKFFDHGMLLITGDHHAMSPVTDEERARFGAHAGSMVPLVIVESQDPLPKVIRTPFQQADLLNSFNYLTSQRFCPAPYRGNLFTGKQAPCLFHTEADLPDSVAVFCGERTAVVYLDGDATRVVSGSLTGYPKALAHLNYERTRHDNHSACLGH